jgi:integrase
VQSSKEKWFGTIARDLITKWSKTWKPNDKFHRTARVLEEWHIPYFEKTPIHQIDELKMREFRKWQDEKFGEPLAASTIRKHHSMMRKVFKEAILLKYIKKGDIPEMEVVTAKDFQQRASFTQDEYRKILTAAYDAALEPCDKRSLAANKLLPLYMEFCVRTGVRSGTETENILWKHITTETHQNEKFLMCNIVKGKTTKYTGVRKIVLDDTLRGVIASIKQLHLNDCKPDQPVFDVSQNQLGRKLAKLLRKLDMNQDDNGNAFSLYSLRHSYITWQLQRGLSKGKIAKQCGTSEAMIEQHYSHVTPSMYARELAGRDKDYIEPVNALGSPMLKVGKDGVISL